MQLICDGSCVKFLMQPIKTVAGITNPQVTRRPNRATVARFFYGFGRSGPLRRAAPCGGIGNPVRPAHPRLPTWQAADAERTRRSVMTNSDTQAHLVRCSSLQRDLFTPCALENTERSPVNRALNRRVQLVDGHATMRLSLHVSLPPAPVALGGFEGPSAAKRSGVGG